MRIAWISDPHFDTVSQRKLKLLGRRLDEESDALIITGDISDGKPVKYLYRLRRFYSGNIFFVLGNHDFYGSWIGDRVLELKNHQVPNAFYLTRAQPIELTPTVGLVGDDGWYDARNGLIDFARVGMRDFDLVYDVRKAHQRFLSAPAQVREVLFREDIAKIADTAVERFKPKLLAAVAKYRTVIVATHFPPFPAAAAWNGECNPYSMPYYSSKAMGDLLYRTALENPEVEMVVMCGHCHSENIFMPTDNLEVFSADADYGRLFVHRILEVDETVRLRTPERPEVVPTPKKPIKEQT